MKKYLGTIVVCLLISFTASAQNYKTGIGVRGGLGSGVTIKHFTKPEVALEGIVATRWQGFYFVGLWEKHAAIQDVDGLTWFYGLGGHIGSWDGDSSPWFNDPNRRQTTVIGVDGIIGLDFTIPNAPINFQLDYKPAFNLIGYSGFWGDTFALSVRFAIK